MHDFRAVWQILFRAPAVLPAGFRGCQPPVSRHFHYRQHPNKLERVFNLLLLEALPRKSKLQECNPEVVKGKTESWENEFLKRHPDGRDGKRCDLCLDYSPRRTKRDAAGRTGAASGVV